jgi:hypothetical protein
MSDAMSRFIAAGTAVITWVLLFLYMMRVDAAIRRHEGR